MMRSLTMLCVAVGGGAVIASAQGRQRPPAGSDYFQGSWMVNPTKTVSWDGKDNTTFEFSKLTVEDNVQTRDIEAAWGVADPTTGAFRHDRTINTVRYNEFDPAKANATNLSVYGHNLPPMTKQSTDNHLVTLKINDRAHISFNKAGGGFFRHITEDLKEYQYVGFGPDGAVNLHRWFGRVQKAGDANIPDASTGGR